MRIVLSENYLGRRTPPRTRGGSIAYEKCRKPRVGGACYVEMFECHFFLLRIRLAFDGGVRFGRKSDLLKHRIN